MSLYNYLIYLAYGYHGGLNQHIVFPFNRSFLTQGILLAFSNAYSPFLRLASHIFAVRGASKDESRRIFRSPTREPTFTQ